MKSGTDIYMSIGMNFNNSYSQHSQFFGLSLNTCKTKDLPINLSCSAVSGDAFPSFLPSVHINLDELMVIKERLIISIIKTTSFPLLTSSCMW